MIIDTFLLRICLFACQVESYVAHIRGLLEERECLTADYERDNELLRQELHQIRQQQGKFSANMVLMQLFPSGFNVA